MSVQWTWEDTVVKWPNGGTLDVSEGRFGPIWCRIVWPAGHTCRKPHALWSGPGRERCWAHLPDDSHDWHRLDAEAKEEAKRAVVDSIAAYYRGLALCLAAFAEEPAP